MRYKPKYVSRVEPCVVHIRLSAFAEGEGVACPPPCSTPPWKETQMRNRGNAGLSSLLSGLQWLTCEECGGLAQELLISPFLGSAKFPLGSCTGSRHCTFMKDFNNIPLLGEFLSKTYTTTHHTLLLCICVCERKREVMCEKKSSRVTESTEDIWNVLIQFFD